MSDKMGEKKMERKGFLQEEQSFIRMYASLPPSLPLSLPVCVPAAGDCAGS